MTRPFKVLGVQQIAIGGPDKTRLQKLWVDMFGLEVTGTFRSERENVDEDICALGAGPFKVEVAVQPGQKVQAGERVAVIEAMKMENVLFAIAEGVVGKVLATKGESLSVDQPIVEFV